jgi:DNA-binding NarL/FixJ family response regulator
MNSQSDKKTKKVFIIDDYVLCREGLIRILEKQQLLEVAGAIENNSESLNELEEKPVDVVVTDIQYNNTRSMDLIRNIRSRWNNLPILVLSMEEEALYAERAIRAGARGYVMKQEHPDKIIMALYHVLSGSVYVSHSLNEKILLSLAGASSEGGLTPIRELTDREFEIFRLIGRGFRPRQIAEKLNLNVPTVESYRTKIRAKLKIKSASDLSQFAFQWLFDRETY